MSTPSLQTFITDASQVLNLSSISAVRSVVAVALANANAGTPLNPNLTTQQLWNEFYQVVTEPKSNIESFIANQMMKFFFSPPAPGGAGADKQVIFNDMGVLAGDAGLVYNKTTDALTVAGLVTAGSATISGALTVDTSTLKVDSTNNRVGIGTATPGYPLQVVGNAFFNADATCKRLFVNDTTGTANAYIISANGSTSNLFFGGQTNFNNGAIIYDDASNFLAFKTNSVEAARFNSTGNLVFPSAKGIDFSATAGTGTSELLNDYEEGTWSPSVTGQVNLTSTTLVSAIYTKIGRVVTVSGSVTTSITASNTLAYFALQNLPFTAATIVPGPLWNDSRDTSGTTQVSGNILYGYLPAASGTTTGSVMTINFSNTYTV